MSRYLKTLAGSQAENGSPAATSFPPTQSHRGRNCSQSTPKSKPGRSSAGIFGLNDWDADGCRPFLVSLQEIRRAEMLPQGHKRLMRVMIVTLLSRTWERRAQLETYLYFLLFSRRGGGDKKTGSTCRAFFPSTRAVEWNFNVSRHRVLRTLNTFSSELKREDNDNRKKLCSSYHP